MQQGIDAVIRKRLQRKDREHEGAIARLRAAHAREVDTLAAEIIILREQVALLQRANRLDAVLRFFRRSK